MVVIQSIGPTRRPTVAVHVEATSSPTSAKERKKSQMQAASRG